MRGVKFDPLDGTRMRSPELDHLLQITSAKAVVELQAALSPLLLGPNKLINNVNCLYYIWTFQAQLRRKVRSGPLFHTVYLG